MVQFSSQPVVTGNIYDGPTEIYVDGTFIGATTGGVELILATEFGEKTADQSPLLLGSYIKHSRGSLKFELEDLGLSNMLLAFANPSVSVGGGNKTTGPVHVITLIGNGPNTSTRTYTIWNGRFNGNTTGKHMLGESVTFSIDIFMEADQSKPDGQHYFSVIDI